MAKTRITSPDPTDADLPKPRIKSVAQWIWAFTAFIGACLFITTIWHTYCMFTCDEWPVTDGVIAQSELKRGFMREGALKFQLHLVYHYSVNDHSYEGKRIAFTGKTKTHKAIKALLSTYPKGRKVQVHYLPALPKVSTLETRISWQVSKSLAGGLMLLCAGLAGIQQRWSLQTDHLFKDRDPEEHVSKWKIALGFAGLTACLGLLWLWWELIKMYAGR